MDNVFFNFDYKGAKILVPIPEIDHEQRIENISTYGTENGIMQITILEGVQEHRILSGRTITYAPDEQRITSTSKKTNKYEKDKLPELTDAQIMLLTKAALDNNAAIVQMSSQIYGLAGNAKPYQLKRWRDIFIEQWKDYNKSIQQILEEKE